jgi:hypothetical protein
VTGWIVEPLLEAGTLFFRTDMEQIRGRP